MSSTAPWLFYLTQEHLLLVETDASSSRLPATLVFFEELQILLFLAFLFAFYLAALAEVFVVGVQVVDVFSIERLLEVVLGRVIAKLVDFCVKPGYCRSTRSRPKKHRA